MNSGILKRITCLCLSLLLITGSIYFIIAEDANAMKRPEKEKRRIEELINIVEDDTPMIKNKWLKKIKAVKELGHLRAVKGIDVLVEKLDWDIKFYSGGGILTREDRFPAILALIRIGKPAVQPIINAVALKDRSDTFVSNAAYTIHAITGEDNKAKNKIEETEKKHQERLQALVDKIPKGINRLYIPIEGKVISVAKDDKTGHDKLVTLNIGKKQGVKIGYDFIIYSKDGVRNICKILIIKVSDENAVGKVIPGSVSTKEDGKPRAIPENAKVSTPVFSGVYSR